jgi:uncharacterized membrane protein
MGKKFIIYGLIGWCAEVFWTGLGSLLEGDVRLSSFTYLWMFPIYGLAVFLEPIHDRIRHLSIIIRGGVYSILIISVEFCTGLLLKVLMGASPWDYSENPLSFYGVIRWDFLIVWFFAGLIFEKIHDKLDQIYRILDGVRE